MTTAQKKPFSLVLATGNLDKVREMETKMADLNIRLFSKKDFPDLPEVEEDGSTLRENAEKKAREIYRAIGLPVLADDTGLEVDALGGRPGVFSSRYAGENASYADNVNKLLREMENVPEPLRTARFRTVMAFFDGNQMLVTEGIQTGTILTEPRGQNGFGYDPVFFVPEFGQTFAEMPLSLKNRISHRGKALALMIEKLKSYLKEESL